MTPLELDTRVRELLRDVTRATSLRTAVALADLGFSHIVALNLTVDAILAKERR